MKKCLLATLLLLTACGQGADRSARLDPYPVLSGDWGWEGSDDCALTPQELHFSADRKQMFLALTPRNESGAREPRVDATYQVLGNIPNGLRVALDGEARLDPTGEPVTWNLLLLGKDRYCWHRSDWPADGCTKSVVRCNAER